MVGGGGDGSGGGGGCGGDGLRIGSDRLADKRENRKWVEGNAVVGPTGVVKLLDNSFAGNPLLSLELENILPNINHLEMGCNLSL